MKQLLGLLFPVLLVAIFTLGTSEVAHAQQATGRIIGNVTDPSDAGVPGVQVKATNVATQVSQETKTDREGFRRSGRATTAPCFYARDRYWACNPC